MRITFICKYPLINQGISAVSSVGADKNYKLANSYSKFRASPITDAVLAWCPVSSDFYCIDYSPVSLSILNKQP